jgi:hypothetical protein
MSITGLNSNTKIFGNQFNTNPTAISLAAATGAAGLPLLIGQNGLATSRNTILYSGIGVFASGFCTHTQINQMIFGTGVTKQYQVQNSRNLVINR